MSLKQSVSNALAPLVGLPLWAAGRAADLFWFEFGDRCSKLYRDGHVGQVGTYALHVACPWCLTNVDGILTGQADLWVTGDSTTADDEITMDQKPGKALVDVRLRAWEATHEVTPLRVESVQADRCGGFVLQLEHQFALEVFPDASHVAHDVSEAWRLLQPSVETDHFVVLSSGIEPRGVL